MKKISAIIILLVLSNGIYLSAKAGDKPLKEGKVVFEMSYPNSDLDEQTLAMMPTESVEYFKDQKVKVDVQMQMGKTTLLSDGKDKNYTILMDMMGKKMAIQMTEEDMKKQKGQTEKPKIEYTSDTKTIAGYTCKKAIMTTKSKDGKDIVSDIWYTKDIEASNSPSSRIEGIDGFMLEYSSNMNGMSVKLSAKSVEPTTVADSDFEIPAGYEKTTMEDLKKMGGGH